MNRQVKDPNRQLREDEYNPRRLTKRAVSRVTASECSSCLRLVLRQGSSLVPHLDALGLALCAGSASISPEDALVRTSAEKRVRRKHRLAVCASCRQLVIRARTGKLEAHQNLYAKRCGSNRTAEGSARAAETPPTQAQSRQFHLRLKSALLEYERLVGLETIQISAPRQKQPPSESSTFRGLTQEGLFGRSPEEKHRNDTGRKEQPSRPYFDRPSTSVNAVSGGSPGSSRRKF